MSCIFAVDDDPATRALIEQAALSLGCTFEGFATLAALRERLRQERPDILVVDGLLPDGNGIEFLRELSRAPGPCPQVVFLSFFFRDMHSYHELLSLGVTRVLHKPISPELLRREIEGLLPTSPADPSPQGDPAEAFEQEIDRLRRHYIEGLPALAKQLGDLATQKEVSELKLLTHRLAGSAGTFGLPALSKRALIVEQALDSGMSLDRLSGEVERLRRLLEAPSAPSAEPGDEPASPRLFHTMLLVDDDPDFAEALRLDLASAGIDLLVARDGRRARTLAQESPPQVALIDYELAAGENGASVATELRSVLGREVPLVFLTVHEGLAERVEASAAGASLYLTKPVSGTQLLQHLHEDLPARGLSGSSVLIADTDPRTAELAREVLGPDEIEVQEATNPLALWEIMESSPPTLVLLSDCLPLYSAFELCRAIKTEPRFRDIPVLIASGEPTAADRAAAFRVGADDYLDKPLRPEDFNARVHRRLRSLQETRQRALYDRLTGLLTRAATEDAIEHLLRTFRRRQERSAGTPTQAAQCPPGVLLFDVDHFKEFNDRGGHQVGDRALQELARALIGTVRAGERVGRWGGEEFLIALSEATPEGFRSLYERVRTHLAAHPIGGPGGFSARLSVSAGGTWFLPHDTITSAIRRADGALYRAKRSGRDRLEIEPPEEAPQETHPPREPPGQRLREALS